MLSLKGWEEKSLIKMASSHECMASNPWETGKNIPKWKLNWIFPLSFISIHIDDREKVIQHTSISIRASGEHKRRSIYLLSIIYDGWKPESTWTSIDCCCAAKPLGQIKRVCRWLQSNAMKLLDIVEFPEGFRSWNSLWHCCSHYII